MCKVLILPVCSWEHLVYGLYDTTGCIASAFEYGRDFYANALENVSSNTTSCEETIFSVLGM